jgi:Ca-activated chloride channel family protein
MLLNAIERWFAHPTALVLLTAFPVLGLFAFLAGRRRQWARARWTASLSSLPFERTRVRKFLRAGCRFAGLTSLVVAIAGPLWGRQPDERLALGRDIIAVLDLSRSMLAEDIGGLSAPNRLGQAKDALIDLADTTEQIGGHRLGLVVFASKARLVCPLTHDYDFFRETATSLVANDPSLEIGAGPEARSGTRLGAGIQKGVEAQDSQFKGFQNIVLLSDGDDPARDREWEAGVARAKDAGIPVDTVGIGDPERASPIPLDASRALKHQGETVLTRLQEQPLKEIARQTGGIYVPGRTKVVGLGAILAKRMERLTGQEPASGAVPGYSQHPEVFFAVAFILLMLELVIADRRREHPASDAKTHATGLQTAGVNR